MERQNIAIKKVMKIKKVKKVKKIKKGKKGNAFKKEQASLAIVPVQGESPDAIAAQAAQVIQYADEDADSATSSSHLVQYKRFSRMAANKKRWPMELEGDLKDDKLATFRMFLKCGGDVNAMIRMKRSFTNTFNAHQGWGFFKFRDLLKKPFSLPEAKAKSLIGKSHSMYDPNFPGDEEEKFYWVRENISNA